MNIVSIRSHFCFSFLTWYQSIDISVLTYQIFFYFLIAESAKSSFKTSDVEFTHPYFIHLVNHDIHLFQSN